MAKNEQKWHLYCSDDTLEQYIEIVEGMLARYEANPALLKNKPKGYFDEVNATHERLVHEYERRTA